MGWRESYEKHRNSKDLTKFELDMVKEEYNRVINDGETKSDAAMDSSAILAYYRGWHEALKNAPQNTASNIEYKQCPACNNELSEHGKCEKCKTWW